MSTLLGLNAISEKICMQQFIFSPCSFNVCDYLKVSSAMKFSPESIASIHLSVKPVPGHLGSHVYGLYREIAALEGIYMFCSKLGLFFQSLTNFFNDRKN